VSGLLSSLPRERRLVTIAPGAVWLKNWLSEPVQVELATECAGMMDGPGGGYVPTVRGGGRMHVRMLCLGRHWNPLTYSRGVTSGLTSQASPVTPAAATARPRGTITVRP